MPETTLYTFVLFGFACFVATLDAKKRWRKHPMGVRPTIWIQTLESSSIGLSNNWMWWKHRKMKMKNDIILNPETLWTLESAQFSACDNFSWETWERQAGGQAGRQGKTDTPSNKAGRRRHHPTQAHCGETIGEKRRQGRQDHRNFLELAAIWGWFS